VRIVSVYGHKILGQITCDLMISEAYELAYYLFLGAHKNFCKF
jgi:hypothetical protein